MCEQSRMCSILGRVACYDAWLPVRIPLSRSSEGPLPLSIKIMAGLCVWVILFLLHFPLERYRKMVKGIKTTNFHTRSSECVIVLFHFCSLQTWLARRLAAELQRPLKNKNKARINIVIGYLYFQLSRFFALPRVYNFPIGHFPAEKMGSLRYRFALFLLPQPSVCVCVLYRLPLRCA